MLFLRAREPMRCARGHPICSRSTRLGKRRDMNFCLTTSMPDPRGRHGASTHADEPARVRIIFFFCSTLVRSRNGSRRHSEHPNTANARRSTHSIRLGRECAQSEQPRLLAGGVEPALRNVPAPGLLLKRIRTADITIPLSSPPSFCCTHHQSRCYALTKTLVRGPSHVVLSSGKAFGLA